MPLFDVNLLFLKTGFVNTKSSALTLHFEDNTSDHSVLQHQLRLTMIRQVSHSQYYLVEIYRNDTRW